MAGKKEPPRAPFGVVAEAVLRRMLARDRTGSNPNGNGLQPALGMTPVLDGIPAKVFFFAKISIFINRLIGVWVLDGYLTPAASELE